MIIYADGSVDPKCKQTTVSYGVVLLHDDDHLEFSAGGIEINSGHHIHEACALVAAIKIAAERTNDFSSVSLYMDCLNTVNKLRLANSHNLRFNFASRENFDAVRQICLEAFKALGIERDFFDVVLDFADKARINWVKAHVGFVYNDRCDHLAAAARKKSA